MKAQVAGVVFLAVAGMVFPALGDEDVQALQAYYGQVIDHEIESCLNKGGLRTSRSANLRRKGHREASKALFLESHKDDLIAEMAASGLAPKPYRVQRFVDDRFCKSCYERWATRP